MFLFCGIIVTFASTNIRIIPEFLKIFSNESGQNQRIQSASRFYGQYGSAAHHINKSQNCRLLPRIIPHGISMDEG